MLKHFIVILLFVTLAINIFAEESTITPTTATPIQTDNYTPTITPQGKSGLVYVIPIKGDIMDRGIAYFVRHSVEQAKEENASLIIFEIDTPGGAVGQGDEYTMGICNSIKNAAPITTVAYIIEWAWSAGALISISADKIVMKSGSSIGSAEVIAGGTDMSAHQEKFTSALRAQFKSTAEKKGYPPNLAMAMVDKDMEVIEAYIDGQREFLTSDEIQQLAKTKEVKEGKTVSAAGKLLNLTAMDALEYGMATAIQDDRSQVPALFGITKPAFKEATPTWSESLVMYITSPVVAGILILAGLIAAGMAMKAPGFGLPELIAIICFSLVFFGHYLVGLAEVTEALIIMLGVGLLAVEIFLVPGFGVFGVSGIILILVGLILSMQGFTIPDIEGAPWELERLQKNLIVVGLSFSMAVILFIIFIRYLSSVPFFHKLILSAEVKSEAGFTNVEKDASPLIGRKGVVFSALRPVGKISLLDQEDKETGETYDVVTEDDFINKGEIVTVIGVEGTRIVVEKNSPTGKDKQGSKG